MVSDHLDVKVQDQVYLESVFHILTEGVHISHNDCLWCVDENEGFKSLL